MACWSMSLVPATSLSVAQLLTHARCALPCPSSYSWVCMDPSETLQTPAVQTLSTLPHHLALPGPTGQNPVVAEMNSCLPRVDLSVHGRLRIPGLSLLYTVHQSCPVVTVRWVLQP